MVSTSAKLWFGISLLALVAAPVYAVASGEEWFGSVVLVTLALAAAGLGILGVALRDGDVAVSDDPAAAVPVSPTGPAPWPALGAVGVGVLLIGWAGGNGLLYVGFGILAIVLVEWMVQSWSERATGDPVVNQALRNRLMHPIEIPVLAALGIALVVLSLSRVLLALPKTGSTVIAMVLASVVLGIAALLAARPRIGSSVLSGVVAIGALALIVGGVVSAVAGEREFEHHPAHETEDPGSDESNNPADDEGGENQSDPGADPSGTH